jgi:hypothetical protein
MVRNRCIVLIVIGNSKQNMPKKRTVKNAASLRMNLAKKLVGP